jgi:undecaprenyl-diphosphatase
VGQRPARFGALTLLLVFALIGVSLAALVALAVHGSGLPRLDAPVAAALTDSPHNWLAAVFLRFTPGSAVIAAAGTLVLIRPVHSGRHRDDPLGGLAVAGATLPLLLLTLVLHGAEAFAHRSDLFAIQNAVLTTAVALATWTFARKRSLRRVRWVVWTLGFAAVLLVAAARLYVGWGTVSSTAAALLIGLIWAGVFTAAWAVRPAPTQTSSGSRYRTRPAEATVLPQDSHGVTPVQQAVVQIGKGLNLVPALAGGSGLGTSSAM